MPLSIFPSKASHSTFNILAGCLLSLSPCLAQESRFGDPTEGSGLVAHWPLDETREDGSQRTGNKISQREYPGKVGTALVLDGESESVVQDFDLPKEAGTLAYWIKPFEDEPVAAVAERVVTGAYPIDQWNHVAITWSRRGERVRYVNCKPATRLADESISERKTWDRFFAARSRDSLPWRRAVDEIKVWSRALSPEEIVSLCRSEIPFTGSGPVLVDSDEDRRPDLRRDGLVPTERDPLEPSCSRFLTWRVCFLNQERTQFRIELDPSARFQTYPEKSAGVFDWSKQLLLRALQLQRARKHIVTLEQRDRRLRPSSFSIESELQDGDLGSGTITVVDADGDGLAESIDVDGPAFLPTLDINPRLFDTNGNGVMDYVGWPPPNTIGKMNFFPLADTNGDGILDSTAFDFNGDNVADLGLLTPFVSGPSNPEVQFRLFFPHFGDGTAGGESVSSGLTLWNLDDQNTADVVVHIRSGNGEGLMVDLNGEEVAGKIELQIPPGSVETLSSDGVGPLSTGSVEVQSTAPLSGNLLFAGSIGSAGIAPSPLRSEGFVVPVQNNRERGIRGGIAVMNLEDFQQTVNLALVDSDNRLLAGAALVLSGGGHRAVLVDQIDWQSEEGVRLDLSTFEGLLRAQSIGNLAANGVGIRPGEIAVLPVAPNIQISAESLLSPADSDLGDLDYKLYFAQFADGVSGGSQVSSEISLLNLTGLDANVEIVLRDDGGNPLTIDLNGEPVAGHMNLVIPKGAHRALSTDGQGALQVGSVTVSSDRALSGTILFSGTAGVSGLSSSPLIPHAFEAPVESDAASGTNTGIAIMNLTKGELLVDLELYDHNNNRLATARLPALSPMGRRSVLLSSVKWRSQVGAVLDISRFSGLLRARVSGRSAASVIRTGAGLLAAQPVVRSLD